METRAQATMLAEMLKLLITEQEELKDQLKKDEEQEKNLNKNS